MDIEYINELLSQGLSVSEVRVKLGLGEKRFQREVKELGYKYNQKIKQYEATTVSTTETTTNDFKGIQTIEKTNVLNSRQTEQASYIVENFDILKEIVEGYKANRKVNDKQNKSIIIDLIDDRHLENKPKSIRVNNFVYNDWTEFCEINKYYTKQELISMALKEYIINHS